MTLRLLALILASVSLSAMAQLALKMGVGRARAHSGSLEVFTFLLQPLVLLGLTLYGFGALLWLSVLARTELSLAYPFVGLGFVLTMMVGALVLGEALTPSRLVGTLLITLGCALVARS